MCEEDCLDCRHLCRLKVFKQVSFKEDYSSNVQDGLEWEEPEGREKGHKATRVTFIVGNKGLTLCGHEQRGQK